MTESLIKSWIEGLSRQRPEFSDQPACPFASRAKWSLITCFSIAAVLLTLRQASLPIGTVLVLKLSGEFPDLEAHISKENQDLERRDLIAYISDPQNPLIVDGYQTTQAFARLIILQRLSELQAIRPWLEKHGYYSHWKLSDLARIGVNPHVLQR